MDTYNTASRKLFALLFAALACMALAPLAAHADEIDDLLAAGDYVEGEVVAAFRTDGSSARPTDGGLLQAQSDKPYAIRSLMTVSAPAPQVADGLLRVQSTETLALSAVTSDTLTTAELMRMLADDQSVAFVEPNYTYSLEDEGDDAVIDLSTSTSFPIDLSAQSDTPAIVDLTPLQWGNWTNSQTYHPVGFTANPSINVPGFGATQRGANMAKPVTVALLDTAVDYQHPDLTNVLYHFSPEQKAALGCWDYGYKAVNDGAQGDYYDPESVAVGHGTHTAGILGAEWNGFGTSGVASDVRIVSIDFLGENKSISIVDALSAYSFVDRFNQIAPEDERIQITSNSWGGMQSTRAVDAAVRELGEKWGVVSVYSAGNDGKNNDHYERPNSYVESNPYAVVVAMCNGDDTLDETSEYGTASVDLASPGRDILSTVPATDATYIPDATRSTDPVYLGFDGNDQLPVTVSQLYRDDNPDLWHDDTVVATGIGTIDTNARVGGTGSLRIDVDPSYAVSTSPTMKYGNSYDIQLDIDLTGTDIADRLEGTEGLHLCYGLSGGDSKVGVQMLATTTNLANITHVTGGGADDNAHWAMMDWVVTEAGQFDNVAEGEGAPTGVALRPANDHLIIKFRFGLAGSNTTLYIDSLGLGTQTVPYGYKTGTSMACPQVAGAGAVLAAQGHQGAELASLLRSKVRVPDPALRVKSGGIFDFDAEGTAESTDAHALAPDITDVAVDGTTVTITGAHFGKAPGSVDASRYVVGAALQPIASTIASWSDDTVVLSLDAPCEGILSVVLYNAAGKWDTQYRFAGKGAGVFEQDLPYDTSTGDPFVYGDSEGDWETGGPLVGLGCKLYHLPCHKGHDDPECAYSRMQCFDLKTQAWTELSPLPEWLSDASAVMYDGKIVVEGASMYRTKAGWYKKTFPAGESAEERVYVYDPATDSWSKAAADGMYLNQTIANENGQLRLAGGSMPDPEHPGQTVPAPVMSYDLSSGAGAEICSMPVAFNNPQVAAKAGSLLIYSNGINFSPKLAPAIYRVQNGQATELEGALPKFIPATEAVIATSAMIWFTEKGNVPYHGVLAPTSDGYVFVGPPAADGSADTLILRDGSDTFEPYGKRSSDDCVFSQAACTYRGRLFVIGASLFEPNNRIFRATAMEVPEYPGDVPCKTDPEPQPDPDDSKQSDSKSDTKPGKKDSKTDDKKTDKKTNKSTTKKTDKKTSTQKTDSTKTSNTGTTSTQVVTNTAAPARTATNDKPLPSTGDTAASPLAALLIGACAVAAGMLMKRRED